MKNKDRKYQFLMSKMEPKEPKKRKSFVFMKTGKNAYALGLVKYPSTDKLKIN